ncbi:MAG TPA: YgaP-like transmembrane domain [Candidatus Angelobacter sp.]|nr:YgaP-like transmembrane domain [Candidatus Angelobacter sp.]
MANRRSDMFMVRNLSRLDRALRVALGIGIGIAGILISGHPCIGRALGVVGALVILSGASGT